MGDTDRPAQRGRTSKGDLPLPPRLEQKLEQFRERLWSVKIAEGALAGLVGLGVSFFLVFILDRVLDTPTSLRASILILGFAVPALGLPLLWHRWVWQQRTLEEAARFLRRRYPRLGDELLGVIELAHHSTGSSRVLVDAAMRQVDDRVEREDFREAVPAPLYRRWLSAALILLSLAGILFVFVSGATQNSLARWISPWKKIERYTFARLEAAPDKLVVPFAEPFDLSPKLAESTEWTPERATVKLPGNTKLSSPQESGRYGFTIPPQKEQGTLSLRVGDATKKVSVEPLPRPELTSVEAILRLPDYLRYEKDAVVPVRGGSLSVVEGATTTIFATTSRDLSEAVADGEPAKITGASFRTTPFPVSDEMTRQFNWRDIYGLEAKSPLTLQITPVKDAAPDIFASQIENRKIVLEEELISFQLSAKDDFGVREIGLEWRSVSSDTDGASTLLGEKPVSAGSPERRDIETVGTFSAKREGVAPQWLQIRAFTNDFLPNRERSYSPAFLVQIMSPQDHAKWLTDQFSRWFRGARESYEREQQLHENNLALRALSAEELDQPDSRRRLQDQASAETSNARRLEAVTQGGRELVGEATKNDEFDAEKLESWAEMVKALDEIAKNRMPPVADLLEKASSAPGGAASATSKDSTLPKNTPDDQTPAPIGQAPATPIANSEKSPGPEKKAPDSEKKSAQSPPSSPPSSGLPQTTLASSAEENPEASPAQKTLDRAIKEQKNLLADFAKITEELQQILSSLEASTFVKRLKAASRQQTEIASNLSRTLENSFGTPRHRLERSIRDLAAETVKREDEQSRFVYNIQTDLDAYYQRKQDVIYKNVLEQMKAGAVVPGLKGIGQESLVNLNGRSIAAAEFWADTLDRWAEELVAAASKEESGEQKGEMKNLPPEIVLLIMKSLQEEMQLRDETREMESTRPVYAPDVYASKVRPLEFTQTEIRERVDEALTLIGELPDAAEFGKEVQLLSLVSDVMRQSHAILARPDTGAEVIAAQTEAIELLLQSKRQQSGGGDSGGSNQGGDSSSGGGGSALSDIGPGGAQAQESGAGSREVEQSTGKAGRELPEEFRRGLDTYFNELESN